MDKNALVTGGRRGIGRAVAERLAADVATAVLTYANNGDAGAPGQRPTVLRDVPLGRRFEMSADQPAGYAFVNLDEGGRLPAYVSVRPVIGW